MSLLGILLLLHASQCQHLLMHIKEAKERGNCVGLLSLDRGSVTIFI